MDPPSYSDAMGKADVKDSFQHMTICDEVGISRTQHVASLVSKLLPQLRERWNRKIMQTLEIRLQATYPGPTELTAH